jgi:hypothetical protein
MPISFLAPLFLAGLAALAIPILIHLTDRERRDVVVFPSLMFVQRIPHQTVRRQRIRNWVLFLLRSAAVALLVLAFARPLVDRVGAAGALRGGRELVILLDRSYSMAYGDRWSRALAAAERAFDGVRDEDRATLVAFSDRAEALTQRTADPTRLQAALSGLQVADAGTRYAPAFQLAAQLLEGSDLPRREVVLISDFQRTGFDRDDAVRLPAGTLVSPVNLATDGASNLAVLDAMLDQRSVGSRDQVSVSARLVNTGSEERSDVSVTLTIDGQRIAATSTSLGAHAAALVRFDAVPLPRRAALGTVSASTDLLERDNRFHFVISPQQSIPVVIVEHPSARSSETLYLGRALGIGTDPRFDVHRRQASQLRADDLTGRPAVIMNDVAFPGGSIGRRLRQHVEDGGRLLVVLARRSAGESWNRADGLLAGTVGDPVDRWGDGGGTLAVVSYDHPVFEVFKAPRSGDFSTARFFRYRAFEEADSATALARFDNGAVALSESRVGRGSVLVLTTGLDNLWNTLTIQPVFLPFVHQLVRYLSRYGAPRPWVTAGHVLDLRAYITDERDAPQDNAEREIVVEAPSGERTLQTVGGRESYLEVREQGFYHVRPLRDRRGLLATIAVNLDPVEADLSALDPDELVGAVTAGGEETDRTTAELLLTPVEKERRQGLWWYLLVTVLILLVAESALSNRVRPMRRRNA